MTAAKKNPPAASTIEGSNQLYECKLDCAPPVLQSQFWDNEILSATRLEAESAAIRWMAAGFDDDDALTEMRFRYCELVSMQGGNQ